MTTTKTLRHPEKRNNPDRPSPRKPAWIRVKAPTSPVYGETKALMRGLGLTTVCEEAACPNIGECWAQRHATVMILGDICTRACAFCNVATGKPGPVNPMEPENVGIMVGLGEENGEVHQVMDDLRAANVDFMTIGQYLQPTLKHAPIARYVTPDEFKELETVAYAKGFLKVSATPLTRSSYHADEDFQALQAARRKSA